MFFFIFEYSVPFSISSLNCFLMNTSLNAGMSYGENCTDIPVLVIFAPTASGKTALCEKLFGKNSTYPFAGKAEIVSADSMQVYKYLDVGTAKPDKDFSQPG